MKYRSCDHSALKAYFHFSPRSLWKEFQHFALISSLTYPTIAFAVDLFVMNPIHGPLMIGSMDRIGGPPLASIPQLVPNEDTILPLFLSLQEQCNKDKMCLHHPRTRTWTYQSQGTPVSKDLKPWTNQQPGSLSYFSNKSDCFAKTFLHYLWHVTCLNEDSRIKH